MRAYSYVGEKAIAERVARSRKKPGVLISDQAALRHFLNSPEDPAEPTGSIHLREPDGTWFLYVINLDGLLVLAVYGSEHVACAGSRLVQSGDCSGLPRVLAAGTLEISRLGDQYEITWIDNNSGGYCPDPASWAAVEAALSRLEIDIPDGFNQEITWRKCWECVRLAQQRDPAADEPGRVSVEPPYFVCEAGHELPAYWNFANED